MGAGKSIAFLSVAVIAMSLSNRFASAEAVYGEAKALGNGFAQVYVDLTDAGTPKELGVSFSESMLDGLPETPNDYSRCFDRDGNGKIDSTGECHGDYELIFMLPTRSLENSRLPFKWVSVNWNPHGHHDPAPPPWAAPHFDFHFYIQDRESVRAIRLGKCSELIDCDDFKVAQKPVPTKYVHADHIDVGAAVAAMGNHLIDSKSPELAKDGPSFTHTFIYGAYDGRITFYEPMITNAYLANRPDMCADLKLPQAWQYAGYYPTRYCIRHVRDGKRYTVSLEGFVERSAE